MKTSSNIILTAAVIMMAGLSAQAQTNVVLQKDDGDCVVPITASTQVTVQADGNMLVDVDDNNLPTCFGSGGAALDVILTVVDPLGSNPIDIANGGSVNVTWQVVGYDAQDTTCNVGGPGAFITAFNNSPAANPNNPGSESFTLTSGSTFSITCSKSGDSEQTVVLVQGATGTGPDGFPDPPAFCDLSNESNRELPFNAKRFGNTSSFNNFEALFGVWPGNSEATLKIPRGKFVALPFIAASTPGDWQFLWVDGAATGEGNTVTISQCPGDLNNDGLPNGCLIRGTATGGNIIAAVNVNNQQGCDLTLGETYYLNIEHALYLGGNRIEGCDESSGICDFLVDIFSQ